MRHNLSVLLVVAAAALTPPRAIGQTLPRMLKSPLAVNIDWRTGQGASTIYIKNDKAEAVECVLSAAVAGAGPGSRTVITFQDADTRDVAKPSGETKLPSGTTALTATVTNALDAAETDAAVYCDGTEIGKLRLWRPTFAITLDNQAEALTLPLVDGQDARIVLKNEDPVAYSLGWALVVGGRQIAKADTVAVQPKGATILAFTPEIEFAVRDLFKETASDGELLLYPSDAPDKAASPVRRFPVHATLSYLSPPARDVWGYLAIIAILVAGGVASLILSYALPNQLQRLDVRERLTTAGRATADLTTNVKSRLSVLAAVERTRLADLLATRTVISPDFAHVLEQVTTGVNNLSARVGILQQIDTVLGRLWRLPEQALPPTRCDQVVAAVEKAQVLLQKTEPTQNDIQAAQTTATAAAALVDVLDQPNAEFELALAKRVEGILATVGTLSMLPTFTRVNAAVPGPLMALRAVTAGAPIPHERCPGIDMAAQKVMLMADYTRLAEGTTDPSMLKRLSDNEPTLLGYLQLDSLTALRSAHLLMREMKEDIYPIRIEAALRAIPMEASIAMDPRIAYERSPLTFCVCFTSNAINDSAARAEWTCEWDFGDGLKESGSNVSHYFVLPTTGRVMKRSVRKTFVVQAMLRDPAGRAVLDEAGAPLVVRREVEVLPTKVGDLIGQRTAIEGLKLAAALFVAVFALVSGAKDQLLKLDLLPGLVAVFVIGFTADTVKNLLTQK